MSYKATLSCLAGLVGVASSNFVSPGLGKCLDIKAELKEDGKRETIEDMEKNTGPINMQLYECHGDDNQHYEIVAGKFKSFALTERCLTAEAAEDNANVHLLPCEDGNPLQQWDLTGDGNVKVAGSDKCIDVEAKKKKDGTREVWHEIKKHKVVNVHLYACHDPKTTERVNQLWMWAPWKDGKQVTEKTVKDFQLQDLGLNSASAGLPALMFVGAAGLFAAGAFVGRRMRRSAPIVDQELLAE